MVVENRPAGGIVAGGEAVATAPPDGYTLLSATPQVAIVQSMVKDLAFDPRRDLAPIALVGVIPNVLVAGPRTPAKTLAELIELARRNPGKLNYSSTGAGTSVHLSAELLKYYAGIDIVHVPYRGAAAAMTALLAGDVRGIRTSRSTAGRASRPPQGRRRKSSRGSRRKSARRSLKPRPPRRTKRPDSRCALWAQQGLENSGTPRSRNSRSRSGIPAR